MPHFVFSLGCTPLGVFAEQYRKYLVKTKPKQKPLKMCYLPSATSKVKPADVYLVETVVAFTRLRGQFLPNSIAVVADSPLLLVDMPAALPIDFSSEQVWKFRLHAVDFRALEKMRLEHAKTAAADAFKTHPFDRVDKLGLILDRLSGGSLLTSLNAITFQLSADKRKTVRAHLFAYLSGKFTPIKFSEAVKMTAGASASPIFNSSLKELTEALTSKGVLYREGVERLRTGKSIESFAKKNGISEFELRFLAKLTSEFDERPKARKSKKDGDENETSAL